MRPFSGYLEEIKTENVSAKYNLAGSTPPLAPQWISKNFRLLQLESSKIPAHSKLLKALSIKMKTSRANIALCPGGSQAAFQVLAAVTKPGDRLLLESPAYEPFVAAAKFLHLKVVQFRRTGEFDVDIKEIKKKAQGCRAIMISNPHCPTGHLYDSEALSKIARIRRLIVDEVFLPLFTNGEMTWTRDSNTITIGSFSKSIGLSSARVGWIRANPKVVRDVTRIGYNLHIDMPSSTIQLAELALRNWRGLTKFSIKRADANRRLVLEFAAENPGAIPFGFARGQFFMLRAPTRYSSGKHYAQALLKHSVWVRPGEDFGMNGFVRVQALLEPSLFEKAFRVIEKTYE